MITPNSKFIEVLEAWASQQRTMMLGGCEQRAFGDRPKAEQIALLRRR